MRQALFVLLLMISLDLSAAKQRFPETQGDPQVKNRIEDLQHEVSNHDMELRMFEQKINNIEAALGAVREYQLDATQSAKESISSNAASLEAKVNALEKAVKSFTSDLRQIKQHSNDTASSAGSTQNQLIDLNNRIQKQDQEIAQLKSALKSIIDVYDEKNQLTETKCYKVKSGDSLGKIAHQHGTTARELKTLNQLNSDRIFVGQTLKLPE